MRVLTMAQITECTGFIFDDGASRLQKKDGIWMHIADDGILIKRDHAFQDEIRVFELQSDDFQKDYMKKMDEALQRLNTCKKFKWEMCSAMDDATQLVFGYDPHHAIYADSRMKHEVVSLHAVLIERIQKHQEAFYNVVGFPEYTIQCKLGKTYKKQFKSDDECRTWIVNHLDLSLGWSFSKTA
ncbi:MAG: hypothetical protein ACMV1K_13150 [Sulfurospirillum sp.]